MLVQPGAQIGRYEVKRTLGRGGMGTVYVAHDPVLGRMVAIKLFSADVDLPDAGQRFAREARSAAALNHPNIVTIFDFGENEAQPFIVMEYVQGDSLAEIIRTRADVSVADKLRWIEGLCAGVAYAHRMSVVHRDIKPANLMIDRTGRLRILDFGIARMIGTASNTAMLLGTPGYTAPEQIKGEPVDHRADIFAAGVVMYELIALREAFPGEAIATIMHRVLHEEPTPLADVIPDLRPEIAAICARALRKQPGERFESADQMREAVSRVRAELDMEAGLTIIPGAVRRDTPQEPHVERPPVEPRPPTGGTPSRRPTGPRRTDR
jgi:serine/threonine-protein kinase